MAGLAIAALDLGVIGRRISAIRRQLAMLLLNSPDAGKMDADLAVKLAEKAYAAKPDELLAQKATALAYAAKKDFAKAAERQEKVVGQLKGALRDSEAKLLDEYKASAGGEKKAKE